jgi:hypothetical protein
LPSTGISPEPDTGLAGWDMRDLRYTIGHASAATVAGSSLSMDEASFLISLKRRSGFYLWKIIVPLLMMATIPVAVFWIDPKEFDWMLKVPMTMLLSMVALEFVVARDLPRIGYVTFLDAVFVLSFVFFFICICEITIVYFLQKRGRQSNASRLHTAGRWAYPAAYFGALGLLALIFLR